MRNITNSIAIHGFRMLEPGAADDRPGCGSPTETCLFSGESRVGPPLGNRYRVPASTPAAFVDSQSSSLCCGGEVERPVAFSLGFGN